MTAFEFFFSFFSLIMGLAAVTLAAGLADALKSGQGETPVKVGLLTPLLAMFMLIDISTFWASGWAGLQDIKINYGTMYFGLMQTLTYFLGASLVFPKRPEAWPSLDDYYDGHKRLPLATVFAANMTGLIYRVGWGDFDGFTLVQATRLTLFFGGLLALILVKNRKASIALLLLECAMNLTPAFLPSTAAAGDA